MQYAVVVGEVEDDILKCLKEGGGIPYTKFDCFHKVMAEDSGQSVLSSIETHIFPLVERLSEKLTAGIQMLDIGCGLGRFINKLAARFPQTQFTGLSCPKVDLQDSYNTFSKIDISGSFSKMRFKLVCP
jgi:SAM-dependent methyltransferase